MENCAVCGIDSKQKCSGCGLAFYCSRDHQILDWKNGHKKNCKCYDIEKNDILGRFMVAKRDIKPGELILREKSIVLGPKTTSYIMCLGCHQALSPSSKNHFYRCTKCTWPLCGRDCEKSEYHIDECKLMASKNFNSPIGKGPMKLESGYCVIVPLRAIILKQKDPKLYEKFSKLESHLEERASTKVYEVLRANLVPFILNFLQIPNVTEKEILNVAGILDTNTFEVVLPSKKVKARGIYFDAAMMAHECIPNTKHYVDENCEMRVIATTAIKKGEKILTTYSHPLKTTIERRFQIKQAKCFDCVCPRCKDPTELNTFSSSIKCLRCKEGLLTSCDPLDNLSEWKCRKCEEKFSAKEILQLMNEIRNKLDNLDKRSVERCETFLKEHEGSLSDSNVFMIEIKYALCMLYGNVDGYSHNDLSVAQIRRKMELCDELIKAFSVMEPGLSNSILNTRFEKEVAKILLIKRESQLLSEHMEKITEIFNLLMAASDSKVILENRLKRIKEQL